MGFVIIQEETTKNPITLIGKEAGICYGADTSDDAKNYKRGLDCIASNHGRTLEMPSIYMVLDGYSARVIRELYTHIGGAPTRLQASTRYINYQKGFDYIIPESIAKDENLKYTYEWAMDKILLALQSLEAAGVPKEDSANLLPLGMTTKVVVKYNPRTLIDMSHQRECVRAYWEFREMFNDMKTALSKYSPEWKYIVDEYFMPKCEFLGGVCTESRSCGRY
jgi:thymidylate synthase (FAD)